MPAAAAAGGAAAAEPAVAEAAGPQEELDEPPEPRGRGSNARAGLMKPLVVLALPGMYLFYKYSQYRREQRELSRRRVTERELQHLHHKILNADLGVRHYPDRLDIVRMEVLDPRSNAYVNEPAVFCGFGQDILVGNHPEDGYSNINRFMNVKILARNECPQFSASICTRNSDARRFRTACYDKLLTKLEENEPEMASSQEDEHHHPPGGPPPMGGMGMGGGAGGGMGGGFDTPFGGASMGAGAGMQGNASAGFVRHVCDMRERPSHDANCALRPPGCLQYSMSGKSWVLPQSASEYNMGAGVPVGVSGPGGRWTSGSVPASASLYSMASGSSSISGVSSVSSATSSSASSTGSSGSSSLGKPSRVRQPTSASFRKTQTHSMKMRIQEYQDPIQPAPEEEEVLRENRERRLPPIKEFQRDYRVGKASTRLRCAQKIVTQLETTPTPTPRPSHSVAGPSKSPSTSSSHPPVASSSAATTSSTTPKISKSPAVTSPTTAAAAAATTSSSTTTTTTTTGKGSSKRSSSSGATPKKVLTVAQEVQKTKKEKEREKERVKAEKARLKEEEKAEKARQKEAKKLAKEEKKQAKKEAKARRKEAEEALLRDVK